MCRYFYVPLVCENKYSIKHLFLLGRGEHATMTYSVEGKSQTGQFFLNETGNLYLHNINPTTL